MVFCKWGAKSGGQQVYENTGADLVTAGETDRKVPQVRQLFSHLEIRDFSFSEKDLGNKKAVRMDARNAAWLVAVWNGVVSNLRIEDRASLGALGRQASLANFIEQCAIADF